MYRLLDCSRNHGRSHLERAGVSGLTPATVYSFRVQEVTRTGVESWIQIVTLLVS